MCMRTPVRSPYPIPGLVQDGRAWLSVCVCVAQCVVGLSTID